MEFLNVISTKGGLLFLISAVFTYWQLDEYFLPEYLHTDLKLNVMNNKMEPIFELSNVMTIGFCGNTDPDKS